LIVNTTYLCLYVIGLLAQKGYSGNISLEDFMRRWYQTFRLFVWFRREEAFSGYGGEIGTKSITKSKTLAPFGTTLASKNLITRNSLTLNFSQKPGNPPTNKKPWDLKRTISWGKTPEKNFNPGGAWNAPKRKERISGPGKQGTRAQGNPPRETKREN